MQNMLKKDLLEVCKQKGIKVSNKSSKEEIVKAIQEHQNSKPTKVDKDPFKGEH